MLHNHAAADTIGDFRKALSSAQSIESVRIIESQAARHYWSAWAGVPVRWPRKDQERVAEHWKLFGSRISPLTHSPRLSANPPNALLNLLYSLLEAEARIAAIAMGMDPSLGLLHVDMPSRDSLACDIMEPVRPTVDAFVLNWLQSEFLRKSDFWEDRDGRCRLVSSLAIKLCQTADTWRRLVAPVTEFVAKELWNSIAKAPSTPALATRLTQHTKRQLKRSVVPQVKPAPPEHICGGCGKPIRTGRIHCGQCAIEGATQRLAAAAAIGRSVSHTPEARVKQSVTRRGHAQACSAWDPATQPAWLTEDVFSRKVQPLLAKLSTSKIAALIQVSRGYAGRIREGYRPHPRHWRALTELVGITPDLQGRATDS